MLQLHINSVTVGPALGWRASVRARASASTRRLVEDRVVFTARHLTSQPECPDIHKTVEYLLWAVSATALLAFALEPLQRAHATDAALAAFAHSKSMTAAADLSVPMPDQSKWSAERIDAYDPNVAVETVEALLHIPKLRVSAPISEGLDHGTLDRAVGRASWGATIGASGNVVLAGHRDSFFRELGDLDVGDQIIVESRTGVLTYSITSTRVVDPDDIDAVQLTDEARLTLITCYPFYFAGPAPQRYLVFAALDAGGSH